MNDQQRSQLERLYPRTNPEGLCDSLYEDRNQNRMNYAHHLDKFKPGDFIMKACRPYDAGSLCLLNNYVTLCEKQHDSAGRLQRVIVQCERTGAHFLSSLYFEGWFDTATQAAYFRLKAEDETRVYDPTIFLANGGGPL